MSSPSLIALLNALIPSIAFLCSSSSFFSSCGAIYFLSYLLYLYYTPLCLHCQYYLLTILQSFPHGGIMKEVRFPKEVILLVTQHITLDKHHFFYPKSKFVHKWQKLLCLHPYCAAMLGKHTEHKWIHITLFEMDVPSSKECKTVTLALDSWLEAEYISLDDSPEEKLKTLIKCFAKINPSVSAKLRIQLEVILSFKGE